jgi:bifunctional DNase/RNase
LIHFLCKDGVFSIDSRPSDAIAIALRFDAPIFVDEKVIEGSKQKQEQGEASDLSEEGKKWAEYLEKLEPDEFGKV